MILLESTTNQILMEEGQVVMSLSDLSLNWNTLNNLFKGTYEQAKGYMSIYDWERSYITSQPTKKEGWTHVKHITYNTALAMQRFMPDLPGNLWEFNPYTKNMSSLFATNFSLEVGKYPTCANLELTLTLDNVRSGVAKTFSIPFTPDYTNIIIKDPSTGTVFTPTITSEVTTNTSACPCVQIQESETITITGEPNGEIDCANMTGSLLFRDNHNSIEITLISKYWGILELDLTDELFYNWYKGNLLTMIGAIKKQTDMSGAGLPFDINQDDLLARARQIMDKVEELKGTKQHWSNF